MTRDLIIGTNRASLNVSARGARLIEGDANKGREHWTVSSARSSRLVGGA